MGAHPTTLHYTVSIPNTTAMITQIWLYHCCMCHTVWLNDKHVVGNQTMHTHNLSGNAYQSCQQRHNYTKLRALIRMLKIVLI